ncbi:hypothetical protein DPMN_166913 [Dreissena polymorpha]|uniref:Uncharacterized protein n=1 Tax=Dreissena polymorpha TaxID=45954 RepID=A0A9D4IVW5_DREPO|nr:hypothetical protein DPMN_166913 [Dreissena polymorpha]
MDQKDPRIQLDQKDHSIENETGSSSVKRLNAQVAKLQEATDSYYNLDVVDSGYTFPSLLLTVKYRKI